ncbi:hypothetical protein ABT040_02500 [Streptomyces sp. NPDC002688]
MTAIVTRAFGPGLLKGCTWGTGRHEWPRGGRNGLVTAARHVGS